MTLCRVLPLCLCAAVHQVQEGQLLHYTAKMTLLPDGPEAAALVDTGLLVRYAYAAVC